MVLIPLLLLITLPYMAISSSVNVGIINGKEAKPHSRPYMVSVQINNKHICGGFLVNERFVMTAAHCWFYGENLTVVLGAHDLSMNCCATRMDVKFYHIHPDSNRIFCDIMLLQLNGSAPVGNTINLIKLMRRKEKIPANTICSVAGWGRTATNGSLSKRLLEVDVTVLSNKACSNYLRKDYVKNIMMCASGHGGFCKGDSGGPLVCNNTAVGIVSFYRATCEQLIRADVYTKISAFLPWIRAILGANADSRGPPA